MRERQRDRSFLQMAVLAGAGGVLAIGFAIGLPIFNFLHGRPYTPAFSLFAAWGVAAIGGAIACFQTYLLSDGGPDRPPHGGLPLRLPERLERLPSEQSRDGLTDRRAA